MPAKPGAIRPNATCSSNCGRRLAGGTGSGQGVFMRTTLNAVARGDGFAATLEGIDSRQFDTPDDLPLNNGIVNALKILGDEANKPLVVRLEGTKVERGKALLAESGLPIISADDLDDAAQKVCATLK